GGGDGGNFTIPDGTALTIGTAPFAANTVTLNGTLTVNSALTVNTLTMNAGTVAGSGALTVSQYLFWMQGSMDGSGTTTSQGTLQLGQYVGVPESVSNLVLSQRTFNALGASNWSGGGSIDQTGNSRFVIGEAASFNINTDISWQSSDSSGRLINQGAMD